MKAACDDDLDAFEELALRLEPRLLSFIYRHVRHTETAQDLTQETLLRVFRYRSRFQHGSKVTTWVFAMALNQCRDWARRRKNEFSLSDEETLFAAHQTLLKQPTNGPDHMAEAHEMAENLLAALEELPDQTRMLIELRTWQGLSFDEAAAELNMSSQAARAAASRAYKKLNQWFQKHHLRDNNHADPA